MGHYFLSNPRSLVKTYQPLPFSLTNFSEEPASHFSLNSYKLIMEASGFSETFVNFHHTARRFNSADSGLDFTIFYKNKRYENQHTTQPSLRSTESV